MQKEGSRRRWNLLGVLFYRLVQTSIAAPPTPYRDIAQGRGPTRSTSAEEQVDGALHALPRSIRSTGGWREGPPNGQPLDAKAAGALRYPPGEGLGAGRRRSASADCIDNMGMASSSEPENSSKARICSRGWPRSCQFTSGTSVISKRRPRRLATLAASTPLVAGIDGLAGVDIDRTLKEVLG